MTMFPCPDPECDGQYTNVPGDDTAFRCDACGLTLDRELWARLSDLGRRASQVERAESERDEAYGEIDQLRGWNDCARMVLKMIFSEGDR